MRVGGKKPPGFPRQRFIRGIAQRQDEPGIQLGEELAQLQGEVLLEAAVSLLQRFAKYRHQGLCHQQGVSTAARLPPVAQSQGEVSGPAPETGQLRRGSETGSQQLDLLLSGLRFHSSEQSAAQALALECGMDGDSHHPPAACLQRFGQLTSGGQGLGQQMAPGPSFSLQDLLLQRAGQIALFRHQRNAQHPPPGLEEKQPQIGGIEKVPEIPGGGSIVSTHHQAKGRFQ